MDRELRIILDIQCFKDNNNCFIIKEISAVNLDTGSLIFHHVVCPPFDRRLLTADKLRESYWVMRHYHGLEWDFGDIPYHVLLQKLKIAFNSDTTIFVKGQEKAHYLKSVLPHQCIIVNLESLDCLSLEVLNSLFSSDTLRCNNHKSTKHRCALSNCVNLRKWYLLSKK